ncbi:MAG: hypothetical protein AAFO29_24515 [Actinomycetota bacterium]
MTAALEETDNSLIGLNGNIDTGTEEGRRLQAAFEDLALEQSNAAQEFADGAISAAEYEAASAEVRAELDRVTGAAGLTTDQVQGLVDKYGIVPPDVETDVIAIDRASDTLDGIGKKLNSLDTQKTITVTTVQRTVQQTAGRVVRALGFKDGGTADGPALVGEEGFEIARRGGRTGLVGVEGPELRNFQGPTEIVPHRESVRLLASQIPRFADGTTNFRSQISAIESDLGGGDPGAPVTRADLRELMDALGDRIGVNIENWNVTDGRDSYQDLRNVESVYRTRAA